MSQSRISGPAVFIGTAGSLLLYAGIRGVNPLQALRDVSTGKPPGASVVGASFTGSATALEHTLGLGGTTGSALVAAALRHRDERYSQPRRWQAGYSDCSSFVGKAFKDIGITPPGASTTASYLAWTKLRRVQPSEVKAGDLVIVPGHMVIAIDSTRAIGQQNRRANVQVGPITALAAGLPYQRVYLRYQGW